MILLNQESLDSPSKVEATEVDGVQKNLPVDKGVFLFAVMKPNQGWCRVCLGYICRGQSGFPLKLQFTGGVHWNNRHLLKVPGGFVTKPNVHSSADLLVFYNLFHHRGLECLTT